MTLLHVGRWLLWLCVPAFLEQAVSGDLEEEYVTAVLPQRGSWWAAWWYLGQVVRSVVPLLRMQWRGDLPAVALLAMVAVPLPLALLELLWAFVYSQVPLKADLVRGWQAVAVNAAVLAAFSATAGALAASLPTSGWWRAVVLLALCELAWTALVLAVSPAATPRGYAALLLLLSPGTCLAGAALILWRNRSWRDES